MRIVRTKQYKLNMGNYESLELGMTVVLDAEEFYGLREDGEVAYEHADVADNLAEMNAFVLERIDAMLKPELEEAAKMSQAKESILPEPAPEPAPARRERTRSTTKTRSNR